MSKQLNLAVISRKTKTNKKAAHLLNELLLEYLDL